MNGSAIQDIIAQYYQPYHSTSNFVHAHSPIVDKLIDSLFMQSLFLPAILHYGKIIGVLMHLLQLLCVVGSANMMIINNDDFDVHHATRVQSIANKLFAFLGLCPQEVRVKEANPPPADVRFIATCSFCVYHS